jgi:putative PIN family toxin of toxin-antitoxin system
MNIIADTNLWVSFLIGKRLATLRSLVTDSRLSLFYCDELINEFKDVASRPKILKYISQKDIDDTIHLIQNHCQYAKILVHATTPVRDAKDVYLLSLADTVHADYIVSGDKDLLVLQKHNQTTILNYTEFSKIWHRMD